MFNSYKEHINFKANVKIKIEPPNEIDKIDKDLQSLIKPLDMMQAWLLSAKYKIQNDIISANNLYYSSFSGLGLFVLITTYLYAMYFDITSFETVELRNPIVWLNYFSNSIFIVLGFLLLYYTNFIYRHDNVFLLLKIQNAFRILKIDGQNYKRINWCIVATLFSLYLFSLVYLCLAFTNFTWWEVMSCGLLIFLDMNIMYSSRLLNLLRYHLEAWVKNVNDSACFGELNSEEYWIRLFTAFKDIFEAYQLLAKTNGVLVSNYLL